MRHRPGVLRKAEIGKQKAEINETKQEGVADELGANE